ncbi:hypothetical protein BD779DRAFT_1588781 [Infundibulicybe gibba]|nr:hypothetical protein BD779DRAFT_1588781 [Infundibulicybe gibba]
MGYRNATNSMMSAIKSRAHSVAVWKDEITRPGEFVDGQDAAVTRARQYNQHKIERAMWVVSNIGRVLHAEPIVVPDGPNMFTRDWAFIELYSERIDWDTFHYYPAGGNLSVADFSGFMFPHPEDQVDYECPYDGLLQASGVVRENEIHQPQHLDIHGEKALLVVKNGLATGTTIGCVNGLDSFTRIYTDYGIERTSIETAILPYNKHRSSLSEPAPDPFSAPGDSGSIILDRAGRIVALLTSGSGTADETDITSGTPYRWLEEQIKEMFVNCTDASKSQGIHARSICTPCVWS